MKEPANLSPLLMGAALVGLGLVLRQQNPKLLELPERPSGPHFDSGPRKVARKMRDGVMRIVPSNLTSSLGRTLVIAGAGLVLMRLLDLTVDDDERLF